MIDDKDLLDLVVSLMPTSSAEALMATAHGCIQEIATYNRVQLLDNGFWWEDSAARKNGERYKHTQTQSNRKRKHSARGVDQPNTCSPVDCLITHKATVSILDEATLIKNDDKRAAQSDDHSAEAIPQSVTESVSEDNMSSSVVGSLQSAAEEAGQLTTWDDPENHIWDNVVHLTKDDPKMLWQIWDAHVAPVLGFPDGIATFKQWTITYNWEHGHTLLLKLADRLSVRYNELSLQAASESSYIDEKLVVAAIRYIRSYTPQTIHTYIEILLRMVSSRSQLVD